MARRSLPMSVSLCALLMATAATAEPGEADATGVADGRDRQGHASAFLLVKANSTLARIPDRIVTAQLDFEKAYLFSLSASRVIVPKFTFLGRGNSFELAGSLGQHFGRERTFEADAAAVLRSGQLGIVGGTSLNVAWGNGLSYALRNPRAESGDAGVHGVGTKKLQYFMSFETEFTDSSAPNVHLVLRLNHRSGMYGVFSSQKTGSNYLGAGLRFDFR